VLPSCVQLKDFRELTNFRKISGFLDDKLIKRNNLLFFMLKLLGWSDDLPTTAGSAKLEWRDSTIRPSRANDRIYLQRDEMVFIPLKEGIQFLYLQGADDVPGRQGRVWFGGTDEAPFLVELNGDIGGEVAKCPDESVFYEALVPEHMRLVARALDRAFVRQGDIFALPLGNREADIAGILNRYSPEITYNVRRYLGLMHGKDEVPALLEKMRKAPFDTYPIFGTRHLGRGQYVESGPVAVFQGRIDAPDHKPILLEDQVHLLGQTNYLTNSEGAD